MVESGKTQKAKNIKERNKRENKKSKNTPVKPRMVGFMGVFFVILLQFDWLIRIFNRHHRHHHHRHQDRFLPLAAVC